MSQKTFQISVVALLVLIALGGAFVAFNPAQGVWHSMRPQSERAKMVVPAGESGQLNTLSLRVHGFETTDTIKGALFGTTQAKESTTFVLVDVSVTNTTNSTFTLYPSGIVLVDRDGATYDIFQSTSGGAIGLEDRAIDGRDLGSRIEERGMIVYEVPKDFEPYAIEVEKADTNSTLVFELK